MISLETTPDRGGLINFDSPRSLIEFCHSQLEIWLTGSSELTRFTKNQDYVDEIVTAWSSLSSDVSSFENDIQTQEFKIFQNHLLITRDSIVAQALLYTSEQLGPEYFYAAYSCEYSINLSWSNNGFSTGALFYALTKERLKREQIIGTASLPQSIKDTHRRLADINNRFEGTVARWSTVDGEIRSSLADLIQHRDGFVTDIGSSIEQAKFQVREATEKFERDQSESLAAVQENISSMDKKLNDWMNSKKDEYRLAHPTTLWNDRAEEQSRSARTSLGLAIFMAIFGLILAVVISKLLFNSSHDLFAKYVIKNSGGAASRGALIDPIFHYALLAAGAGTLVYLTLFLWLQRLIIRSYVTAQHLAIDAQARSAMAQTYIGLVREGTVKRAERAIVLDALFRPVTSGMVQEDGPPPISPAAILAAAASSKSTPG
ncbi:DUF6161 domain-containing protein [uncultured Sphingomonas sp.]|uniref:DUF6161 domain-containing protein n=1 Tax=uncultured Sphingomonas sp. TaxID=158754 RepID=UPI0025837901|nr:DUF6161 domain-containing protein [uncultured Sphingomonas sp.]